MPKTWSEPRPLAATDLKAVTGIERESPSPWDENQIRETLTRSSGFSLVCEDEEGGIAAWIILRRVCDEAEILKLTVAERHRRRGLGQQLLARVMADLAREGIKKIFLEVRATNRAAIGLYQKRQFSPISRRRNYYNNPKEDAICMEARPGTINQPAKK